ncbi:MAG: hypothetical protein P4N60_00470 [Verrucomicrobiae bacterium]|nr:hypothetical protein [Verrucomicrobiae bacterium]
MEAPLHSRDFVEALLDAGLPPADAILAGKVHAEFLNRFANRLAGEQENMLRAAFERITHDTHDPATIGRRALAYAQALDCPSAKRLPPPQLAQKLCVSRQTIYRQVDKSAQELAGIKGDSQRACCHALVSTAGAVKI